MHTRTLKERTRARVAGAALSFTLCLEIPFIKDYALKPADGGGKSGTVTAQGATIVLAGRMHYYDILFVGRLQVFPDGGTVTSEGGALRIANADSAVIFFALGTNYRLGPHVFLETDPKKKLDRMIRGRAWRRPWPWLRHLSRPFCYDGRASARTAGANIRQLYMAHANRL